MRFEDLEKDAKIQIEIVSPVNSYSFYTTVISCEANICRVKQIMLNDKIPLTLDSNMASKKNTKINLYYIDPTQNNQRFGWLNPHVETVDGTYIFRSFSFASQADKFNRRNDKRITVNFKATIHCDEYSFPIIIRDMSYGGIAFTVDASDEKMINHSMNWKLEIRDTINGKNKILMETLNIVRKELIENNTILFCGCKISNPTDDFKYLFAQKSRIAQD